MHFIRRDSSATFKLKTRYRYFIRLARRIKRLGRNLFNFFDLLIMNQVNV